MSSPRRRIKEPINTTTNTTANDTNDSFFGWNSTDDEIVNHCSSCCGCQQPQQPPSGSNQIAPPATTMSRSCQDCRELIPSQRTCLNCANHVGCGGTIGGTVGACAGCLLATSIATASEDNGGEPMPPEAANKMYNACIATGTATGVAIGATIGPEKCIDGVKKYCDNAFNGDNSMFGGGKRKTKKKKRKKRRKTRKRKHKKTIKRKKKNKKKFKRKKKSRKKTKK